MSSSPETAEAGDTGYLAGRLLIAMPGIGDPRFEHAVVLVCIHNDDHAMGVRINLPLRSEEHTSELQSH